MLFYRNNTTKAKWLGMLDYNTGSIFISQDLCVVGITSLHFTSSMSLPAGVNLCSSLGSPTAHSLQKTVVAKHKQLETIGFRAQWSCIKDEKRWDGSEKKDVTHARFSSPMWHFI